MNKSIKTEVNDDNVTISIVMKIDMETYYRTNLMASIQQYFDSIKFNDHRTHINEKFVIKTTDDE